MAKTTSPPPSDSEPTTASASGLKQRSSAKKTANKASATDVQEDQSLNSSSSFLSKMVVALAVLAALALAAFTIVPYVNTKQADVSSSADEIISSADFETHKSNLHSLGLFNIQSREHFDTVTKHTCALVVYKATWCGHCKNLMPKLEEAAKKFATHEMPADASGVISFVECTTEGAPKELCEAANIKGYPTLHLHSYGELNTNFGKYDTEGILSSMKDCVSPAFAEIAKEDASALLAKGAQGHTGIKPLVLFYFKDQKSAKFNQAFEVAKKQRFNFKIGHTSDEALFKKLLAGGNVKRAPADADVLIIHAEETPIVFGGETKFSTSAVESFLQENKIPLVGKIDPETYEMYSTAGKRLLFFFHSDDEQRTKFRPTLAKIAKKYRASTYVVFLDANKFGGHGTNMGLPGIWPDVAIQDLVSGEKWLRKESLEAAAAAAASSEEKDKDASPTLELSAEQIEKLADGVEQGTHDAHLKSEPVPSDKDAYKSAGSPRTIVSLNFEDVVLKQTTRDVFVFFHAPWCGHCKKFSPTYAKISKLLHAENNSQHLELTMFDATKNDVPKSAGVDIRGFPTIVLYRASNKEPLTYDGDRSYEGVLKWLRDNCSHGNSLPSEEVADKFVAGEEVSNEEL